MEGKCKLQRATGLTAIPIGQQPGFENVKCGTKILPDGTVIAKTPIPVLPRVRTNQASEPLIRRSAGIIPHAIMVDDSQTIRRRPAIASETVVVKPEQYTGSDLLGKTHAEIDSLLFTAACQDLRRAFFAAYPNGNGTVEEFVSYLHTLGAPQVAIPTLPMGTGQKTEHDNASAEGFHVNPAPQIEELRRQLDSPASPYDLISQKAAEARAGLSADFGQPDRMNDEVTRPGLFDTIRNIFPIPRRNIHSNSLS